MAKARKSLVKQKTTKAPRKDGWENSLTGIGTIGRDKRKSSTHGMTLLSDGQLECLYRENALAAQGVNKIVDEAFREGYELAMPDDLELADTIKGQLSDLKLDQRIMQAAKWCRAYGGAAIFVGVDDGEKDLRKPLDPRKVKAVTCVNTFRPTECYPIAWYANPLAPKYGEAQMYRLTPEVNKNPPKGEKQIFTVLEIHESRIIPFQGVLTSNKQIVSSAYGWGDSVLQRAHEAIQGHDSTWDSVEILVSDFSQAVINVAGLGKMLAVDNNGYLKNRIAAMDMSRSVARALVLDENEKFTRVPTPMTGIPETLDRFMTRMSMIFQTPVSLLFGQGPAGLNATGDADLEYWYAHVGSYQEREIKPALEFVIKLLFLGKEPANWDVTFNPLAVPSDLEVSQTRLATAQKDQIEIQEQVVTPEEVAASRYGVAGYSRETTIDLGARKQMQRDREARAEQEAKAPKAGASFFGKKPPSE